MAAYALYPAAGAVVLDENGNVIPTQGIAPTVITPYYTALELQGLLLRQNPLADGSAPLYPPGAFTNYSVTPDQFLHLALFSARVNAAIVMVNARGGGTVRVAGGDYVVTGLGADRILPLSDVELVFDPGCTITSGAFTGSSIIIEINTIPADMENIRIRGNGLRVVGYKGNPDNTQYLVVVNCQTTGDVCRDIVISDLRLEDACTDGLLVSGNPGGFHERVVFERVTATGARRNGGAANQGSAKFIECHFDENGDGQHPESGFDVEPDDTAPGTPALVARDITFERCTFDGNTYHGLLAQVGVKKITARIRVMDCTAHDNGGIGFVLHPDGSTVSECRAFRNGAQGFYSTGNVRMVNCEARDNGEYGFAVANGAQQTVLSGCVSSFNHDGGYVFSTFWRSSGETLAFACTAFANQGRGFDIARAQQARVVNCSASLNKEEGIKLFAAQNCQVVNTACTQNGLGIDATYDNIVAESTSSQNNISFSTVRSSGNYHRGTVVVDATYTTLTRIKLAVHASQRDTPEYVGMHVEILSGTEVGATGWITAYDDTNQSATVAWDVALGAIPSSGTPSVVEIIGGRLHAGTVVSATATTVVLSEDLASSLDGAYTGYINVVSGTGAGQRRAITGYTGAARRVTWSSAMSPVLDDTSEVEIVAINKPRYGIRLEANAYLTLLHANDAYYGGASGGISDVGTDTNAANNRST